MKTNNKISTRILRRSTAALLFSCAIVALCSAITLTAQSPKAPPPACVPPPPDMVSWWPGDGTTDDIIDGNNGTFHGTASYATGEVGQAFSFDEFNYVEVPDAANLDFEPNAPITVDMWVYRTRDNGTMHMLGKRVGCTGNSGINYQMGFTGAQGLFFGGNVGGVETHQDLPLLTWTHLAGTFDGSTIRFYINGELAGTVDATSIGPTNDAPLRIGTSGDCEHFVGLIDEIELFNRALSQEEIQSIVDAGTAGKCKPTSITLSAAGRKVGGINTVRLTWSGATSTDIDVYRDDVLIVTTANDGSYRDSTGDTGRARYTYQVCEAGTETCSNDARVAFAH